MNPAEILGSLLGRKSGSSGSGGGLLRDILGGGRSSAPTSSSSPHDRIGGGLYDLIRDAHSRYERRAPEPTAPSRPAPRPAPEPKSELDDELAVVLIRAMINAAKSDGQLDKSEQDAIVKQLGQVTEEEIEFLRREFSAPLDVKEFAWSVPLGREQQVYSLSLMTIRLDENKEAEYLRDLAHGLRLTPEVCDQLHEQMRAPKIRR